MRENSSIVVVGSINTDLVVSAKQMPRAGETVTGSRFSVSQGGKGANQAVAAARLGGRVKMIGMLGNDGLGDGSRRALQAQNIDCEHVGEATGASGVALITVDECGANTIVVVPGANAAVTPEFLESKRTLIREAGVVLTQLEIPVETVLHLARLCKQEGVPLMLDPAPAQALPDELFSLCAWLTPNETEAAFYATQPAADASPQGMIDALRRHGAHNIILKRGSNGALIDVVGGPSIHAPAFHVDALDTTAAGDTFNGAFAVELVAGKDPKECGRLATAAAALSVTRHGAQASMPSRGDVERFLEGHGERA